MRVLKVSLSKHRLGLLGLGCRATTFYLQDLNQRHHQKFGGFGTCPLILVNTDFDQINPYLPDNFDRLEPLLAQYLKDFPACDSLVIPNISLHETLDRISERISSKTHYVHPVEHSVDFIKSKAHDGESALILGTRHSMNSTYLKHAFRANGIELITPNAEIQDIVDSLRRRAFDRQESANDVLAYRRLVMDLSKTQAVLIACTELSLLTKFDEVNVFDMARIQLKAAYSRFSHK